MKFISILSDAPPSAAELAEEEAASRPFWHIPYEFAVHAIVGTAIFAVIAVAAILLDMLVHRLAGLQISSMVILGLRAAADSSFFADLSLFLVFLWRTALRAARRL